MRLVNRWQYVAHKFDEDFLIYVRFTIVNSTQNKQNKIAIQAQFISLFLGGVDSLLLLMKKSFLELGLKIKDCIEISWIEFVTYFDRSPIRKSQGSVNKTSQHRVLAFKAKLDYVKKANIEKFVTNNIGKVIRRRWSGIDPVVSLGGKMSKILESEILFVHRAGCLYKILYYAQWEGEEKDAAAAAERHINWTRSVYNYMSPYVSKNPRASYLNYRDLDLGKNNEKGHTSYT
ncbi:LOW QUALITY PROTEIN: hypothetical protein TorRG33x02_032870 [Trema orientale]|uniref:Uncharacterized protein n=1 Tax=Trema orientale TaxID=63057 RepID=A0A2P5FTJ9_TREOI|nr:LOW QUALITY PROTEIN: hypothetical protein TorRG33x02_032870 [Trema orientale]